MSCCQRLSRGYLIVTNCLFACFGCALMVFGTLGAQQRLGSSILFPINVLKMINILGIILVFSAVTGFVGAICIDRQAIHILYTTIILIVFIYQIATALIVYDQAVHTSTWLSQTWSDASQEYRYYAQSKFTCCGFSHANDHPVSSPSCQPDDLVNSAPPCYKPLTQFVQQKLQIVYIVLFAALSIEILALSNAITLLCARYIGHGDEEQKPKVFRRNNKAVVAPEEQMATPKNSKFKQVAGLHDSKITMNSETNDEKHEDDQIVYHRQY